MAIYHFETQVIKRSAGRSSVACAAYRSGERLFDERTGEPHRQGDATRVVHTEIVAPADVPPWALKREQLWNMVEAVERRIDSQVAREWELALPVELSLHEQLHLVRGWVIAELTPNGVIADIAVHDKRFPGKMPNPHSHVLGTLRSLGPSGWGEKWERAHNKNELLARWRASWADHTNRALEQAGFDLKVTHLSHEALGKRELPTIKEGAGARGMEARGEVSDRAAENRRIREHNGRIPDVSDRLGDAGQQQPVHDQAVPIAPSESDNWSREPGRNLNEDEVAASHLGSDLTHSDPAPASDEEVLLEWARRQSQMSR